MRNLTQIETWIYGLVSAFISGGAGAITTNAAFGVARSAGMDVPILNLQALGVLFVTTGIIGACAYLKQSPLPQPPPTKKENDNTEKG